jgi:hypothetical protein
MDRFSIIQNFFTRMNCNLCERPLQADGIELLKEDKGMFVVGVNCQHCNKQIGIAMVGVEAQQQFDDSGLGDLTAHDASTEPTWRWGEEFEDPELTPDEVERLSIFKPITDDDVLDAHHFFQSLDTDWMKLIPPEALETSTAPSTEFEVH